MLGDRRLSDSDFRPGDHAPPSADDKLICVLPARILRGIRIAARLGLTLSKEIKSAIFKQTSSISRLGQFRKMMQIIYMLSFGAAESSILLLHKYHILEILLPFQAAYMSQEASRSDQSSKMLMFL
ncbi:hypothetical protein L1887_10223 [Cichorium endivia]|nr:hypothetical protein L1887_10223 [Cichorium endivia]